MNYKSKRYHLILDAHDIKEDYLTNEFFICGVLQKISNLLEMNILHGPTVVKGVENNPGLTAFSIIDYSHISIHTFTETNEMNIDIFSCKPFDFRKVKNFVKKKFTINDNSLYHGVVKYDQIEIDYNKKSFNPRVYLNEYYTSLSKENKELLRWFNNFYKNYECKKILEVGGGPTIYQLISASKHVKSIIFTDCLVANLREVNKWIGNDSDYWDKFIQYTLSLEGIDPTKSNLSERKDLIRSKINKVTPLDIGDFRKEFSNQFDVVQSIFCLEAATNDISELERMLTNIFSYLKRGGKFNLVVIEGAKYYKLGDKYLPAIYFDKDLIKKYLSEVGFKVNKIKKIRSDNSGVSGYTGILFIEASKLSS